MTDTSTFWARRRAGVQAEAQAEASHEEEARLAALQAELAEKDDETLLQDMGLPDPETLQPGDDFAAFMAKEVPTHLRNRALRKLWRSNPVLACVDGLNEYDDDYRAAMLAGGPIKTAYQVGKGMLSHLEEMARKEEERLASDEGDADEITVEETAVNEPAVEDIPQAPAETAPVDVVAQVDVPEGGDPAPRRMRFRFEEVGA